MLRRRLLIEAFGNKRVATVFRAYLVLVFLANLGGMVNLVINLEVIMADYPRLNGGLVTLLFVSGVASLIAAAS